MPVSYTHLDVYKRQVFHHIQVQHRPTVNQSVHVELFISVEELAPRSSSLLLKIKYAILFVFCVVQ